MAKYKVEASYGVVKTYSKVYEVEANSEEEAEEIAEQLLDGIDDTWETDETEVQWGDFAFDVEDMV